jgi:hypothetical protein
MYASSGAVVALVSPQKNIEKTWYVALAVADENRFAKQGMVEKERREKAVEWLTAVGQNSG